MPRKDLFSILGPTEILVLMFTGIPAHKKCFKLLEAKVTIYFSNFYRFVSI